MKGGKWHYIGGKWRTMKGRKWHTMKGGKWRTMNGGKWRTMNGRQWRYMNGQWRTMIGGKWHTMKGGKWHTMKGGKWHTTTEHHTTITKIVNHASGMKQQYLQCQKNLVIVRRNCNLQLRRLRSIYRSYTLKIRKARRIVGVWKGKYVRCMRFCWWRANRIRKGDEVCDVTNEEERDD